MHSWGGYKLVKVLLNFGLSPKIHADLKDWSPDLYYLFIYLGAKQRDMSKKERADELLSILLDKTLHTSYFGKLSFGSREKFAKMANTTSPLPLVILTWLCKLQEDFYEIGDTNKNGDWNKHKTYCPVKAEKVSREFPLDNMHMIKANSATETKNTTLKLITPDNSHNKKVVKSLKEWAAKILCWENDYMQDLGNADNEEKHDQYGEKPYSMSKRNYKPNHQKPGGNVDIVKDFQIEQQQSKSPHQLYLHLSQFMTEEIGKLAKTTSNKKPKIKTSYCLTVQMKQLLVLLHLQIKEVTKKITTGRNVNIHERTSHGTKKGHCHRQ